jgi:hypothetical protein
VEHKERLVQQVPPELVEHKERLVQQVHQELMGVSEHKEHRERQEHRVLLMQELKVRKELMEQLLLQALLTMRF